MLHTLTSIEVKVSARGQRYAVLSYKLNPDDKLEVPKRMVLFDKYKIEACLTNPPIVEDIVTTEYTLDGMYQTSSGEITNRVCVKSILHSQYEMTNTGLKYIGKTFARGYSPEEIAERMKTRMIKL